MERQCSTWLSFRLALERETGKNYPPYLWDMLRETLSWSAIHEPYSEGDIEIALKQVASIQKFMLEAVSQASTCREKVP